MMPFRPPTPTTEERRREQEQKDRAEQMAKLQRQMTSGGSAVRPTLRNLVVVLRLCAEWKGVIGIDPDTKTPVFLKKPPFDELYDIRGERNLSAPITEDDRLRIAIWMETNTHLVIDRNEQLDFLLFALRIVGAAHGAGR